MRRKASIKNEPPEVAIQRASQLSLLDIQINRKE